MTQETSADACAAIGELRFSTLSVPAARLIWVKSGEVTGHGLLAYLLDVSAVSEAILDRETHSTRQWASTRLGVPAGHCGRWVGALAGLHDFGKAIPGFQAKWPEGMRADQAQGLAFPSSACGVDRHDLATATLLGPALQGLIAGRVGWLRHVVQAVSAHHGYHFLSAEIDRGRPRSPRAWG